MSGHALTMSTETRQMRVMGWSNGQPLPTGAGYGVRISGQDRDEYFDPGWDEVILDLRAGPDDCWRRHVYNMTNPARL